MRVLLHSLGRVKRQELDKSGEDRGTIRVRTHNNESSRWPSPGSALGPVTLENEDELPLPILALPFAASQKQGFRITWHLAYYMCALIRLVVQPLA